MKFSILMITNVYLYQKNKQEWIQKVFVWNTGTTRRCSMLTAVLPPYSWTTNISNTSWIMAPVSHLQLGNLTCPFGHFTTCHHFGLEWVPMFWTRALCSNFILWKTFGWDVMFEHRFTTLETNILLMAEILHQLIADLPPYLQGFIHPWWCRISSINSVTKQLGCPKALQFHGGFGQIFRPTPPGRSLLTREDLPVRNALEKERQPQVVFIV